MKQNRLLLTLFFFQLLFTTYSCIQREDNPFITEYKVKGRLVQSCDNPTPIAHKLVILETDHTIKLFCKNNYKVVSRAYTDDNGYFELKYDKQNCISPLKVSIEDPNGHPTQNYALVTYLKGNENTNLDNVYLSPTASYNYVIKTNTPYTQTDTLFYNIKYAYEGAKDSTPMAISGPFTNGQQLTTFLQTAQRQIHHGDWALQNDRYDYEYRWVLKTANGQITKGKTDKIIFTNCLLYTIHINLSQ